VAEQAHDGLLVGLVVEQVGGVGATDEDKQLAYKAAIKDDEGWGPEEFGAWFEKWVAYLRYAQTHGGFEVW